MYPPHTFLSSEFIYYELPPETVKLVEHTVSVQNKGFFVSLKYLNAQVRCT